LEVIVQDNIGRRSQTSLFCYVVISIILLALGGWLTYIGLGNWYYALDFPPFQPPAWLFTPAWVIVLSCLALSTWLVTDKVMDNVHAVLLALALYGGQCVLNAGWSLLFFTMQRPDIALWELAALDAVLIGMMWTYSRVSIISALLLLPYAAWLLLSTAINNWIVMHNTFPLLSNGTL
jgi:tryptophan-rich sensory protein